MIVAMLQSNPEKRPRIGQLLNFEFLTSSPVPTSLPSSCLTMAPRPDLLEHIDRANGYKKRTPLVELNALGIWKSNKSNCNKCSVFLYYTVEDTRFESTFLKNNLYDPIKASGQTSQHNDEYRADIENLYTQLTALINSKVILTFLWIVQGLYWIFSQPPKLAGNLGDENTDPAAQPLFWISKWVDYSDKYGFGYQLCDEGMGVMFNDTTKLLMLPNGMWVFKAN